jgi:putative radical SAM enzyme (TIGR03279 family)
MKALLDAGIEIHAQVVLCPGINDGAVLEQTIRDLAADYPRISSVAIVPLGLTRYNTDSRLTAVSPEFCRQTIAEVTKLQRELRKGLGTNFAFLGDEIYLRAGAPVPSRAHYGDLPQIEDGVGMVRSFRNSFASLVRRAARRSLPAPRRLHGTILTGTLFAPALQKVIEDFNVRFATRFKVESVANNYFGGDVSVAGLLTGGDFLSAKPQISGDFAIIPKTTLKSDEDLMLDGTTLAELTKNLGVPVYPLDLKAFSQFVFQKN